MNKLSRHQTEYFERKFAVWVCVWSKDTEKDLSRIITNMFNALERGIPTGAWDLNLQFGPELNLLYHLLKTPIDITERN